MVGGPKQAFDEKGQKEIDKFIMEGKGVVFLVDGMALQAPGRAWADARPRSSKMGQPNDTGLGKLLEAYGFKVNQDFVFDPQNAPGPIDINGRPMLANLPFFVAAETADRQGADRRWTASAARCSPSPPASIWWARSRAASRPRASCGRWPPRPRRAGSTPASSCWAPGTKIEEGKERSSSTLAYAYQGPLKSAFAPANAPAVSDPNAPVTESKKPVRLVVVGDSDFANDEYVQLARASCPSTARAPRCCSTPSPGRSRTRR